jgi:hypothetical protein
MVSSNRDVEPDKRFTQPAGFWLRIAISMKHHFCENVPYRSFTATLQNTNNTLG